METFLPCLPAGRPVDSIANLRPYTFPSANNSLNRTNIKNEFLLMLCEEMLKNSFKLSSSDNESENRIAQDLAVKMAARKLAEQIQRSGFLPCLPAGRKGVQP